jgi:hypothetical protein
MAGYGKIALILLVIGTLTSAQQISAEPERENPDSVLLEDSGMLDLAGFASGAEMPSYASGSDTLETYEIELEDTDDKGINYKVIGAVLVTAAFLGYALYLFLDPGDEEEESDGGGKPFPGAAITVPLSL